MKLNLFSSSLNSASFVAVVKDLSKYIGTDTKVYIVVPDRASLSTEEKILNVLNINGFFNFEIVTLNILADTFVKKTDRQNLSSFGAGMVIRDILIKNKDKFCCFTKSVNNVNFASTILATISQIKSCNILPQTLQAIANNATGGLKLKLTDISLIYKEYEEYLQNNFSDGLSKFASLTEEVKYNNKIKESVFAFVNFASFTLQAENILTGIIKNAKEVYIGFTEEGVNRKNTVLLNTEIAEMVKRICDGLGISYYRNFIKENFLSAEARFLNFNLLNFESDVYNKKANCYQIVKTDNVEEELVFIASDIKKRVRQENKKFSDFSIAVTNIEAYKTKIKEVFKNWGVPFYLDVKVNLSGEAITKFLISVFKVFKNDFSMLDVLELSKNYFCELSGEENSQFENYVIKYGKNGAMFFDTFKDESTEVLRNKVIDFLLPFYKRFKAEKYAGKIAEILKDVLLSKNCEKLSKKLGKEFAMLKDYEGEKLSLIAVNKIYKLLDEITLSLSESEVSVNEFLQILNTGIQKNEISLVPLTTNSVFIGSAADSFFKQTHTLYICGAVEGSFPTLKSDVGIILDEEIKAMSGFAKLEPSVKLINDRALNKAFELLFVAQNTILTYSTKINGENTKCSVLALNLKNCLNLIEQYFNIDDFSLDMFNNAYPSKEVLRAYFSKGYSDALKGIIKKDAHFISALSPHFLDDETKFLFQAENSIDKKETNFFKNNFVSVSQLTEYFKCPLSHFFKYGLKLREQEENKIKAVDIGNIYHLFCFEFMQSLISDETSVKKNYVSVSKKLINNIFDRPEYKEISETKENVHLVYNAKTEVINIAKSLIVHYETSEFKPTSDTLEQDFRNLNFNVDGDKYTLNGKIDRLDVCEIDGEKYGRVIDYKTGTKDFDLDKIYVGEQLQLPAYLFSLSRQNIKPAGMFYFPISNAHTKNKFSAKLSGVLLNQKSVAVKMDNNLINDNESITLPVKFKLDGNFAAISSTASAKEFDTLLNYTEQVIENAISEINTGYINPSILKSNSQFKTCDFCPYFVLGKCCNPHVRELPKVSITKGELCETK